MRKTHRHASDRRLERRLARKVTKGGQKYAPEVYEAYLAGLQRGLEIREEQQATLQCMSYRDIFGNEIPSMKARDAQAEDGRCIGPTESPSASLH